MSSVVLPHLWPSTRPARPAASAGMAPLVAVAPLGGHGTAGSLCPQLSPRQHEAGSAHSLAGLPSSAVCTSRQVLLPTGGTLPAEGCLPRANALGQAWPEQPVSSH